MRTQRRSLACRPPATALATKTAASSSTTSRRSSPPPTRRSRYIQVGPFGCPAGEGCPPTLAARPEGDVTVEQAGGALSFHVTMRDGTLAGERQDYFGVSLPPVSKPPIPVRPLPYTLGHCGLGSGVDFGGSWWDPIGFVDSDHGDAINAAEGTMVIVGPDRALFTSKAGLAVQLARRDGEKFLPLCQ